MKYITPSRLAKKMAVIKGKWIAADIREAEHPHKRRSYAIVNDSPWQRGVCRICGKAFEALLNSHALAHGFASAQDMINAGEVKFVYGHDK